LSLVFLYTPSFKMLYGCKGLVVGNFFTHFIFCSSLFLAEVFVSFSSYLYKSKTLKIGEIPMSGGNSISYAFAENFLSILHGPIFFSFNLLYSPLGNLSFLRCANTKSPTSKFTSLLFKSALLLYFLLLSCSCCLTFSWISCISEAKLSP